jgi:hypothetical protein
MNIAILAISSLSLVVSAATLAVVIIGGKKAQGEVKEVKTKANASLMRIRNALDGVEI